MALFLIFSESWQSFCQTVQQTFPMRGKTLPDRKYVFQNPDKKQHFKRKVKKVSFSSIFGTIHLRRRHVLGGEGCPQLQTFADVRRRGGSGSQGCRCQQFLTLGVDLIRRQIHKQWSIHYRLVSK